MATEIAVAGSTATASVEANDIVEAFTASVALLDADGVIRAVNEAWRQFARANDYEGEDFGVGTSYLAACGAEADELTRYASAAVRAVTDVLSGKLQCASFDYPCHAPDRERWFRMVVSPCSLPDGPGALVLHNDVTEEILQREAIQRTLCELPLAKAVKRKVAGVIHDVKSPLNAISGMTDFLRQGMAGPTTPKQQEYFGRMLDACEQACSLIDSEISRLFEDADGVSPSVVDVKSALRDLVEMLSIEAAGAKVVIDTAFTAQLPLLAVPPAVVTRVVGNLVTNAIRYAGPGSRVIISAAAMGNELAITVADDGVGVSESELEQLMRPRQRGRCVRASGSGLGLSVVRDLANRYGASFAVVSAPKEGLSVTLTFSGETVVPVFA